MSLLIPCIPMCSIFFQRLRCDETMSVLSGETFMTSLSRDLLEDWLAVLFQENQTKPESGSSLDAEVGPNPADFVFKLLLINNSYFRYPDNNTIS